MILDRLVHCRGLVRRQVQPFEA